MNRTLTFMKKHRSILPHFNFIIKLVVLGLLISSFLGCEQEDVATKRARTKIAPEAEQANTPAAQAPAQNTNVQSPTSPVSNAQPAPAVKKTVDCDKKCFTVYDRCTAEYRQFPDVETICRGKQTTCLSGCSSSAPKSKAPTGSYDNCVVKGNNSTPLRVRSSPGGGIIGSLKVGADIQAYDLVQDRNGENWTKIKFQGGTGYVSTQFISCG